MRDPARDRIAAATVRLIGSHGLAATGVEALCEHARVSRRHFYRCFVDMEDCFLSVHDDVAAELCETVTSAYEGPVAWHDRVWAAGWAAMRFMREDPLRARFLVVAVNGSGSRAQSRRDRIVQRLVDLLDAGREGLEDPGSTSRCSAEVAAGALYRMLLDRVEAGDVGRGVEFLPELVYMAVMPYLGARAAEEELLVQPLR